MRDFDPATPAVAGFVGILLTWAIIATTGYVSAAVSDPHYPNPDNVNAAQMQYGEVK